jgi:hypothetical protein
MYQTNSSQFTYSQPISQRTISMTPPFPTPVVCQIISGHDVVSLRRIKFILIKIFKHPEELKAHVNILIICPIKSL